MVYAGAGLGPGTWLGLIGTGQIAAFGTGSDSSESVLPFGFQLLECLLPGNNENVSLLLIIELPR